MYRAKWLHTRRRRTAFYSCQLSPLAAYQWATALSKVLKNTVIPWYLRGIGSRSTWGYQIQSSAVGPPHWQVLHPQIQPSGEWLNPWMQNPQIRRAERYKLWNQIICGTLAPSLSRHVTKVLDNILPTVIYQPIIQQKKF